MKDGVVWEYISYVEPERFHKVYTMPGARIPRRKYLEHALHGVQLTSFREEDIVD